MKNREEIEKELSLAIASALVTRINESGKASLLVSGGSTPVNMFALLSKQDIPWDKVTISLVDERFVKSDHQDSNERLIREHLLQNAAKEADFIPLVVNALDSKKNIKVVRETTRVLQTPFTVVVLGMGTDGHTASLFPESPQLKEAMSLESKESLMITEPRTAPYERVSFTRKALLNSEYLFLHCYGAEKSEVLREAKEEKKYPIASFIHQNRVELSIFWAN